MSIASSLTTVKYDYFLYKVLKKIPLLTLALKYAILLLKEKRSGYYGKQTFSAGTACEMSIHVQIAVGYQRQMENTYNMVYILL